jgi:hypothetical protein
VRENGKWSRRGTAFVEQTFGRKVKGCFIIFLRPY